MLVTHQTAKHNAACPCLCVLCLQVHTSKPTDPEFHGMVGGLGVFGIMTEFLMQMTPPKAIQLITVRKNDTDMFNELNSLLKVNKGSDIQRFEQMTAGLQC